MSWYGGAEQYSYTSLNSAGTTVAFTSPSRQLFVINRDAVDFLEISLDGGTVFAAVPKAGSLGPLDVSRPSIVIRADGSITGAATISGADIISIHAP